MAKNNLKFLIEQVAAEVLWEERTEVATDYVQLIKNKDPELFDDLMKQAAFAINSVKNGSTPLEEVEPYDIMMRQEPDMDPIISGDTHGVRLFIDYLIRKDNPSVTDTAGEYSGKTKRFYQQVIDSRLRKRFAK